MGIARKTAITRIATLTERIEEHLKKIASNPSSIEYNHWLVESVEWCQQIEAVARHVGKRTQREVMNRVAQWKETLASSGHC